MSEKKPTQAEILLQIVTDDEVDLYHDPMGEAYARVFNGQQENYLIRSAAFRNYLLSSFYKLESKPPSAQALQDALGTCEARARYGGKLRNVWLRTAKSPDGNIYLDIGDDTWDQIRITPDGWSRIKSENSEINFRRSPGMLALPDPVPNGDIKHLQTVLGCGGDELVLAAAWLTSALRSDIPYVAAMLQGEQGSAKTTNARKMRGLVDPSSAPVQFPPDTPQDLFIAAQHSWVLAFDNLSGISQKLSNSLCLVATEGSFRTRQLFTNAEESIITARRPVIMTAITDVIGKADMADRSIFIPLKPISESDRKTEAEVWQQFDRLAPSILGALLDAAVIGLQPHPRPRELSRMADFEKWVIDCEHAFPWEPGTFKRLYRDNRRSAVRVTLDSDPVADGIRQLMEDRDEWTGSPTELHNAIKAKLSESATKSSDWPKTPSWLSRQLQSFVPLFREVGIQIETERKTSGRIYSIRKTGENAVTGVTVAQSGVQAEFTSDDKCDGKNVVTGVVTGVVTPFGSGNHQQKLDLCDMSDANDDNDGKTPHLSTWDQRDAESEDVLREIERDTETPTYKWFSENS